MLGVFKSCSKSDPVCLIFKLKNIKCTPSETSVIYSLSCCSKLGRLSFFCGIEKEKWSRMTVYLEKEVMEVNDA